MSAALQTISLTRLALAFVPVLLVVAILWRWSVGGWSALYAIGRMLVQLLLVGYILTGIFQSNHAGIVMCVLCVMLLAASWISLRPVQHACPATYWKALLAIGVGGFATLLLATEGVLQVEYWFQADVIIPLAGMALANSMNSVSLAAERFQAELSRGHHYIEARRTALNAALIPLTNSLLAVGIVSFPGMMTGQILSGVSPLIAARYQIMVMCMVFGAAGISAAVYLRLSKPVQSARPAVPRAS